jgi:hypothetical protein
MSDLVNAGVDQIVKVADNATDGVLEALDATKDIVVATVEAPIHIGDKTLDVLLDEAKEYKKKFLEAVQQAAKALSDAVPLVP